MPVPVNTVVPQITGSAVKDGTLSCSTGTWTNTPLSYAYQWIDSVSGNIGGATSATYIAASGNLGHSLTCRVTATNGSGAGTPAVSGATDKVLASIAAGPVDQFGLLSGSSIIPSQKRIGSPFGGLIGA